MGWIRKQFRRIRRRVKKLLSTKFGRIIGGIGLSMAMGWAAGKLFEGAKTLFGGVQGASGAAGPVQQQQQPLQEEQQLYKLVSNKEVQNY